MKELIILVIIITLVWGLLLCYVTQHEINNDSEQSSSEVSVSPNLAHNQAGGGHRRISIRRTSGISHYARAPCPYYNRTWYTRPPRPRSYPIGFRRYE
ncbi:hypothetical protein CAEBREN_15753 [Caenorhabditis brenneri]|uniref:Uncharacterized protein n=1 Tax=Caenorhabditis brenneri TaxID=135651 RepID=G0MYG4_CAEBE|nr:hypothetical protein CAEBREN_15753 [Caenorhabditis brenneri]